MTYPSAPGPDPRHPQYSVSKSRKKTSHTFHLLMCLFTCGLWVFVWMAMAAWNAWGPRKKTTTYYQ